jgi:hypothetical protein
MGSFEQVFQNVIDAVTVELFVVLDAVYVTLHKDVIC